MTMYHSTLQHDALTPMFDLCRHVISYLDGKLEDPVAVTEHNQLPKKQNIDWLIGEQQDLFTIQALIDDLEKSNPDAGHSYFKARTWHLLCWQPIYIAFISIYGLKQLPDFTCFKQQRQHNAIVGFTFHSDKIANGQAEQLIPLAASQLAPLLEHYRTQLDSLQRCRPGYSGRFIADLILGNLLKVKNLVPDFSDQDVLKHAQLWIKAMGLPEKLLKSLKVKDGQTIDFVRTSCCLAYKVNSKLCSTCPKAHK